MHTKNTLYSVYQTYSNNNSSSYFRPFLLLLNSSYQFLLFSYISSMFTRFYGSDYIPSYSVCQVCFLIILKKPRTNHNARFLIAVLYTLYACSNSLSSFSFSSRYFFHASGSINGFSPGCSSIYVLLFNKSTFAV